MHPDCQVVKYDFLLHTVLHEFACCVLVHDEEEKSDSMFGKRGLTVTVPSEILTAC